MLTLRELKKMVNVVECEGKMPTARQLKESELEIAVKERIGAETEISVYENGFVLYQVGNRYTVFSISDCGMYGYETVEGEPKVYDSSFFENENWYVRLIMEAEDRMERNQEKRKSNHKVYSYDRLLEDYGELKNTDADLLDVIAMEQFVQELLSILNERQREVIYLFYVEQWKQQDISDYFGVTQQSVSEMIKRALKILNQYVMRMEEK